MPLPVLLVRNRYETARRLMNKYSARLSEVDQSRLLGLQLQAAYGRYQPGSDISEFHQVSLLSRRKREEAWRAVGSLSRQQAMERYLELVRSFMPNWEKELEFADLEISPSGSGFSSADISKAVDLPVPKESPGKTNKSTQRTLRPMLMARSTASLPQSRAKGALNELQGYDLRRITTSFPKLNRLNAGYDAAETVRRIQQRSNSPQVPSPSLPESKYYRQVGKSTTPRDPPADQVKAVLSGFLDTLQSGVNFAGDTALWDDQAKDVVNRLEFTFATFAKACEGKVSLELEAEQEEIRDRVQPRFSAAISALEECERLMSDSSEPCAGYIAAIKRDLKATSEALLDYVADLKAQRAALDTDLSSITLIHRLEHETLALLKDRYYVNDPKYGLGALRAEKKATMELKVSELCSKLPSACTLELRKLEENLKIASETVSEMHRRQRGLEDEREKLRDEIRLIQLSAYQENILLSNMYKDLKKSVGIIQGSEGRGMPSEMQLKKELDEAKSELLVLRKDNEGLKERMREVRRRNSIVVLDESQ